MTFGKYAEQPVESVPDSYLIWCAANMPRIPCYVVHELDARGISVEPSWTSGVTEMAGLLYYRPEDFRERESRSRIAKKSAKRIRDRRAS
jgi:hypothetical protein